MGRLEITSLFLIISSLISQVLGESYPECGECFCVPDDNGTAPCPMAWHPQTEFADNTISIYQKQSPKSFLRLECNPYTEDNCTTTPKQEYLEEESAVCAYLYPPSEDGSVGCDEYEMVSYPSRSSAEAAGAVVTHEGSCGLCSTTQDLALYLTTDFTDAGKICATKGLLSEKWGLHCYMALGLTRECAKIWNYDGIYDGKTCTKTCLGHLREDNNGPAPACELNPCLQCDEDYAGPLFSAYGGRTRRRSGLLSEIIRPCSTIAKLDVYDPCTNPVCGCL